MELSERTRKIIEDVTVASAEIPFGNSAFQNNFFVMAAEITPGRALRHCLLRLHNRIAALKECYYSLQLEDIDIAEMEYKMTSDRYSRFAKQRYALKIEQKKVNRISTQKMIEDCIQEIETLYSAFQSLPKMNRIEFENEERKHFELKLAKDALIAIQFGGAAGAVQSLDAMGADEFLKLALENPESVSEKIKDARTTMGFIEKLELGAPTTKLEIE